jgi:hypothetical protein
MAGVLQEFGAWIQREFGASFDKYLAKLLTCRQELLALGLDKDLKCLADFDGAWQRFGQLIGEHALPGLCGPPLRPAEPEKPSTQHSDY